MNNLAEALRLLRVFNDKKVTELAQELGISPGHLSDIEHGNKKPSLELLMKYSEVFKIKVSTILLFSEQMDESLKSKFKSHVADKMIKFLKLVENEGKEI